MKLHLEFPVRAEARDDGGRSVTAFGVEDGIFHIPDGSAESHPMAIEFRSGRSHETPDRYRMDAATGKLLRPAGLVSNVLKDRELKRTGDGEPCFRDLFEARCSEYEALVAAGKPVYPEPGERQGWSITLDRYPLDAEGTGLLRVSKRDTDECHALAQAYLSTCLVVDGHVWEPCQEPTLKVKRGNEAWTVQIGHHPAFASNWHTYYFSVDEFDLACQWIDTLDEELGQRPRHQASMRMDPHYEVVKDGGVEDMRMLCSHVLERVAAADKNLASQTPDIIAAYAKLKRFLSTSPPSVTEHAVDEAVAGIMSIVEAEERGEIVYSERSLANPREVLLSYVRSAIDLHIRRWDERPIHDVAAGPMLIVW